MTQGKKVVLITGASSGIGLETALYLLRQGYKVYGGARRTEPMQPIADAGGTALSLDVTDEASMQKAVDQIISAEGRLDVLVNNAGYGLYGPMEEVTMDDARHQMEVNIFGLARMTQLVLPHMRAQKSGRIINISSIGGTVYFPLGAWYHATKHAVEAMTDVLRTEVTEFGIHVSMICPGLIDTGFGDVVGEKLSQYPSTSPYHPLISTFVEGGVDMSGSKPIVIAKAIHKSITATKPKTRYRAGQGSLFFIVLFKLLPYRAFDWVLFRMFGYKPQKR